MLWYQKDLPEAELMTVCAFALKTSFVEVVFKGIRYSLLLEWNKGIDPFAENGALFSRDRLTAGMNFEEEVAAQSAGQFTICEQTLQLYGRHLDTWAVPAQDCPTASAVEVDAARRAGYYNGFPCHRQLRTVGDALMLVDPTEHYLRIIGRPIANMFPGLYVFTRDRLVVQRRDPLADGILLVEAARDEETGERAVEGLLVMKTVYSCFRRDEQDFIREARTLGKLPAHPNVVPFHGLVVDESGMVDGLVTSYLDGKLLSKIKQATVAERERWASQIDAALKVLHEQEIVWGDVKAGNVMITSSGDAVILDFGGSWTPGWVTEEDADTIRGDWIGYNKIVEFLERLPVPDEDATTHM